MGKSNMAKFGAFIRSHDAFGQSIGLNYRGESHYKTLGGGLLSLAFKLAMLSFLVAQSIMVFNFEDPKITSYEVYEQRGNMAALINVT